MTKIVVRLPEPRKEYSEDNQRQINRSISLIVEQLNATNMYALKGGIQQLIKENYKLEKK